MKDISLRVLILENRELEGGISICRGCNFHPPHRLKEIAHVEESKAVFYTC